jgi:hypothetical protein
LGYDGYKTNKSTAPSTNTSQHEVQDVWNCVAQEESDHPIRCMPRGVREWIISWGVSRDY